MSTPTPMQLGMVGLGRMGAGLVRRLMRDGHRCVVYDVSPDAVAALVADGAVGANSLEEFASMLETPRSAWIMVPAGQITDDTIAAVGAVFAAGDVIIDGGNTYYRDDLRHAAALKQQGIHHVDVGTSGGVWGLERGFCLMIGGETEVVDGSARSSPRLRRVPAPPRARPGAAGPSPAEQGYLHCGPNGAGHFVKMVHNGIEYGMMAAYAEGLNIIAQRRRRDASARRGRRDVPARSTRSTTATTSTSAEVAEVWRRGSVVASWLLDLTAEALHASPALEEFAGRVSDSGEGRWTSIAAIEVGVPAPVLTTALYSRFASRDEDEFANKVLSAMRKGFGGHDEKSA